MIGIPSDSYQSLRQNHPQPTHSTNRGTCPMGIPPGSTTAADPLGSGTTVQHLQNGLRLLGSLDPKDRANVWTDNCYPRIHLQNSTG